MSGFAFVLFAYWAILNLSLANSLMCQDYKYCLHIEGKWQRKTSKLGKHKTPQGTPPPQLWCSSLQPHLALGAGQPWHLACHWWCRARRTSVPVGTAGAAGSSLAGDASLLCFNLQKPVLVAEPGDTGTCNPHNLEGLGRKPVNLRSM